MKIELQNLTKKFPNRNRKNPGEVIAVNDFTFEIPDGQLIGLLGPSGCGKSTTLNLICGLEKPTAGKIFFGGRDVTALPPELRGVGMVFQNYALYPHMTVRKNILFPLENLKGKDKLTQAEMNKRAEDAARLVQIDELMDRKPGELSGGQQQRVAIARALVKLPQVLLLDEPLSNLDARLRLQTREEIRKIQRATKITTVFVTHDQEAIARALVKLPQVLLLDEPLSNLDARLRLQTREEIRKIQRATKITTVFVTHDQEEAISISDLIVVMKDGLLQQIGKPQEVYDNPQNLFVAKFLGTPPIGIFRGEVRSGKLYIGGIPVLSVPGAADGKVLAGIRPEGFLLREDGPLCCSLAGVEVMGRESSVVASHPDCEAASFRAIVDASQLADPDAEKVRFALKPEKVYLFDPQTEARIPFQVR